MSYCVDNFRYFNLRAYHLASASSVILEFLPHVIVHDHSVDERISV